MRRVGPIKLNGADHWKKQWKQSPSAKKKRHDIFSEAKEIIVAEGGIPSLELLIHFLAYVFF